MEFPSSYPIPGKVRLRKRVNISSAELAWALESREQAAVLVDISSWASESASAVALVSPSDAVLAMVDDAALRSELDLRDVQSLSSAPEAGRSDWARILEVIRPENPRHQSPAAVAAADDSDCVHLLPQESDPDSVAAENS